MRDYLRVLSTDTQQNLTNLILGPLVLKGLAKTIELVTCSGQNRVGTSVDHLVQDSQPVLESVRVRTQSPRCVGYGSCVSSSSQ